MYRSRITEHADIICFENGWKLCMICWFKVWLMKMFLLDPFDSWGFRLNEHDIHDPRCKIFRTMCNLVISGKFYESPPPGWPEKTVFTAVRRRLQMLGFRLAETLRFMWTLGPPLRVFDSPLMCFSEFHLSALISLACVSADGALVCLFDWSVLFDLACVAFDCWLYCHVWLMKWWA